MLLNILLVILAAAAGVLITSAVWLFIRAALLLIRAFLVGHAGR